MTKIKLCGLTRICDIDAANALRPEYAGFVFWKRSKRYVTPQHAAALKKHLAPGIAAVGVFIDEPVEDVARLLSDGVIDIAQLHGNEDEAYIEKLRALAKGGIIKALRVKSDADIDAAKASTADYVLLDSGAGTGQAFDWRLIRDIGRPYFLAGGLDAQTVGGAIERFHPFAVDVSSGIETDGLKDENKMAAFVAAVRKGE